MQTSNIQYQEERVYASTRLILLFIFTLASFIISTEMVEKIPLVRLVLEGLIVFSIAYNAFIAYKPDTLVQLRKNVLIFVDLLALTLFIIIFEQYGIYLFGFYVLIVMQSGLYFGLKYIYTSLFSAVLSWVILSEYSEYWTNHYDIIIAFAMTTLILSMFALRFIRTSEVSEIDREKSSKKIEKKTTFLKNIADRSVYQDTIEKKINHKETFNLLFIGLENFKKITESYGIETGEQVMNETAQRLNDCMDNREFFARLGTNEFVVISSRERSEMRTFLKSMENNTRSACIIDDLSLDVKINIGVSFFPENGQSVMAMSKAAGDALRAAEKNNSAQHVFYGGR